ncbi:MAG TPA: TonB-dependent receptor [Steroidobacteraceae bacterium]|nr:TonB-dependent receptor [Steroidobacteraceae bacterium]
MAANRIALLLILGLASVVAFPGARAADLGSTTDFHIPASDLPTALVLFSRQAHLQVVSAADEVSQWMTSGVDGRLTAARALATLLTSTDLDYRITATGVVTVGHFSSSSGLFNAGPHRYNDINTGGALAPHSGTSTDVAAVDPPATGAAAADPAAASDQAGATAPADQSSAPSAAASGELQEVVVTAERRAENVQTTPISVVAISGDELQAASVTTINDLQQVAPDLTIETNGGSGDTINIRGIGLSPVGADAVSGVVVVRDGLVDDTAGVGLFAPFYDIADVEVLRGPQGTFAGDNSTGGAINITSQNPNFRGYNGYVTTKVATYSDIGVQGAVNLPVTDTLALRLAFNEEKRGSFFYDEGAEIYGPNGAGPYLIPSPVPGCEEPACGGTSAVSTKTAIDPGNLNNIDARLGILWKPTDNFQSLTKIEIDDSTTEGLPTQPNTSTFAPLGAGLPCPAGHGTAPNCTELYLSGYSGSPYVLNSWDEAEAWNEDINMYSEELRYTLPSGTVARLIAGDTEVGNLTNSNTTGDSIDIQDGLTNNATSYDHMYNAEFDLISPTTGALSWIAGAAWSYTAEQFTSFTTTTTAPYSDADPAHGYWCCGEVIYAKSEGIFGQTSWQMTPTLQFQVGARLSWDNNPARGATVTYRPPPLTTLINLQVKSVNPTDNSVPTGKIGFNWTPVKGQYFYIFFAHGYKPGLENIGFVPPTTKEWVNDYELGWKGTLAHGHVLTDVGPYFMQYQHMEESIFNPYNVRGTAVGNLPMSTIEGIEASMQAQLGHFGLDISADYNRSVLGHIINYANYAFPSTYGITNQCAAGQVPNSSNTNCTNYLPYQVSLTGEELPYSPLFQANATLKYAFVLGSMSLQPRVTYSYVDKSYASLFDIPFNELPSHGLVNAYLDWTAGPWTATLFGTNLGNKVYLTNIGSTSEYFGAPRQLGLQVNRTF